MLRSRNINAPSTADGNLYYVRLKTPMGVFYKLGFTKMNSVEARLGFQGTGDEHMIDRVFLFSYRPDAFTVEQRLHNHFSDKRIFGQFGRNGKAPLSGNGQSELYAEDILGMDEDFSMEQRDDARGRAKGQSARQVALGDRFVKMAVPVFIVLLSPLIPVFKLLGWFHDRYLQTDEERKWNERARKQRPYFEKQLEKSQQELEALIAELRSQKNSEPAKKARAVRSEPAVSSSPATKEGGRPSVYSSRFSLCSSVTGKQEARNGALHLELALVSLEENNWEDFSNMCDTEFLVREAVYDLTGVREGVSFGAFARRLNQLEAAKKLEAQPTSQLFRELMLTPILSAYHKALRMGVGGESIDSVSSTWPGSDELDLLVTSGLDREISHFIFPSMISSTLGRIINKVHIDAYNEGLLDFHVIVKNDQTGFSEKACCRADLRGVRLMVDPIKVRTLNLRALLKTAREYKETMQRENYLETE